MKQALSLLLLCSLPLLGACRATPNTGGIHSSDAPAAVPGGDREVEACISLSNIQLTRKGSFTQVQLDVNNTCSAALDAQVRVHTFDRLGKALPDGVSGWISLSLKPGGTRTLLFDGLPQACESWTLIARKRRGDS